MGEREGDMGREQEDDGQETVLCDWCGQGHAQEGAFFVPGQGILNLCGSCRMLLMAVLLDGGGEL